MPKYYVTVDGDVVAGPFDTRREARERRDDLNTSEVGTEYRITRQ